MCALRILVTGSSSGIGAATVQALAAAGHTVHAGMRAPTGRNAAAAAALVDRAGPGPVLPLALDVTDPDQIAAAHDTIAAAGGLDVLVHAAGVVGIGLAESMGPAVAARIFDVNVTGVVRVQQAMLPLLRAGRSPRIVYISSTLAREVLPMLAFYTASKHALDALAEAWAYELHAVGIRSVIVQPGTIPTTNMLDNALEHGVPERSAPYGELAAMGPGMVAGLRAWGETPDAPQPAVVAEAVCAALQGDTPLRVVVDPSGFDGAARVNAAAAAVQAELLAANGMEALARPPSAP